MKKIILFTYIFSIISLVAVSQDLALIYNGSLITNDTTIIVSGNLNGTITCSSLSVKNNTTDTLRVKVKKIVIDSVINTTNSFCYAGSCFGTSTYVSPTTAVIAADSVNSSFVGDYYPVGKSGVTTVLYVFYNINNLQDTVCVNVAYEGVAGINEIQKNEVLFADAYPNPANNYTTFSYSLPKLTNNANIIIRNLLGSEVMNISLDVLNGKKAINTNDLQEGIYFYSLVINDKIYNTRKLIVKH